ncbi:MAG: PTS fructose transporter subunit IIA [Variovorax sp.]|jgi:PTS system mannose-specific IIA component|nr:MAG: PTS fructose transporter subunit IIA [Variovorax sp.]
MNSILIIAHAPLANALRQCALHVFPDTSIVSALDVLPNVSPEETLASARIMVDQMKRTANHNVLVLVDVFGATPCNVAQKLVVGEHMRMVVGVNLPMLMRVANKPDEALETLVERAIYGGKEGVMTVAPAAPQNQSKRKPSDQDIRDHQQ